jgi:hypothetical protein
MGFFGALLGMYRRRTHHKRHKGWKEARGTPLINARVARNALLPASFTSGLTLRFTRLAERNESAETVG